MTTATQSEFAKRMGYAKSTVTKMKQEGRLVMTDGGLVDIEASVKRIDALASPSAHHRAHAQQLEEAREEKGREDNRDIKVPVEGLEELNLRLKKADADKREHEAEIARLDRELKEKKQIMSDAVKFSLNDHTAAIRTLHENAPDRLTPLIHPLQTYEEKHAAISEFMEQVQLEIYESSVRALERLVSEE